MKEQQQCKLQLVTTTTCASGMFAPVERRKTPQAQGSKVRMQGAKVRTEGTKVRANISATWYGMQQKGNTTTTTTDHADMTNTARWSNHCNLHEG